MARKVTLTVKLVIEERGNVDARHIVNEILDAGVFQDAINEYETDDGTVRVRSVICE